MYETIRIVKELKPKYVLWENVKNLLSQIHIHNYRNYIKALSDLGYNSYYKILNSKDFGIPQNRERVFTLSIRQDIDDGTFQFPKPFKLKLKLKDLLEEEVDEKFYLSNKAIEGLTYQMEKEHKPKFLEVEKEEGKEFPTLTSSYHKQGHYETYLKIKDNTKKGYLIANEGDGINISSRMKHQRGNVQKEMIQTLDTLNTKGVAVKSAYLRNFNSKGKIQNDICNTLQSAMGEGGGNVPLYEDLRIRKLTPKECWKLMRI